MSRSRATPELQVQQPLPAEFALASTAAENIRLSGELAWELIEQADRYREIHLPEHDITPLDPALIELALGELERLVRAAIRDLRG